jgi:hypothetical protein
MHPLAVGINSFTFIFYSLSNTFTFTPSSPTRSERAFRTICISTDIYHRTISHSISPSNYKPNPMIPTFLLDFIFYPFPHIRSLSAADLLWLCTFNTLHMQLFCFRVDLIYSVSTLFRLKYGATLQIGHRSLRCGSNLLMGCH